MKLWYALVDLLPFEWAEPGQMLFMKNALLAVLLIAPLFGTLSTMVVQRRMSFFSDALGHSAFTGVAIGTLCGLSSPPLAAAVFAVPFALLFTWVRRRTHLASDTVIGVFSSAAVAFGICIATLGGGSFTKFNALLVGDILSVQPGEIAFLAGMLVWYRLILSGYNDLLLSSLHPALADSRGVNSFRGEVELNILVAVLVALSMPWVGLMVINSLLVLPAAAARNIAKNTRQYHLFSVLGAVVCGVAGLLTSYYLGSSAGAVITLYLAGYFIVSTGLRRQ